MDLLAKPSKSSVRAKCVLTGSRPFLLLYRLLWDQCCVFAHSAAEPPGCGNSPSQTEISDHTEEQHVTGPSPRHWKKKVLLLPGMAILSPWEPSALPPDPSSSGCFQRWKWGQGQPTPDLMHPVPALFPPYACTLTPCIVIAFDFGWPKCMLFSMSCVFFNQTLWYCNQLNNYSPHSWQIRWAHKLQGHIKRRKKSDK